MATTDLMLDDTHDIAFDGVNISIGTNKAVVAQRIYMRLSIFRGEWFVDKSFGVPYYKNILGKNFNPMTMNAIFVGAITGTPGVRRLAEPIQYKYDAGLRTLALKLKALLTTGEILSMEFPSAA